MLFNNYIMVLNKCVNINQQALPAMAWFALPVK